MSCNFLLALRNAPLDGNQATSLLIFNFMTTSDPCVKNVVSNCLEK